MNGFQGLSLDYICRAFDERYGELAAENTEHKIQGLFRDEYGFLLLDVCEYLPHAPHLGSLAPIRSACASSIKGCKVIVYEFYFNVRSIGENALLILVKTEEPGIRLFAVETHLGGYYLCEYRDNSHRNYGKIEPSAIAERVAELL